MTRESLLELTAAAAYAAVDAVPHFSPSELNTLRFHFCQRSRRLAICACDCGCQEL